MDSETMEPPTVAKASDGMTNAATDDTGARAVVTFLEERGDRHVFGVTGSSMVSIFYELKDTKLEFITSVHESAAVAMADGYARVTGHACVLLYMMQGSTNCIANLYNASRDNTPVTLISTQPASRAHTGKNIIGEGDVVRLLSPVTKFARELPPGSSVKSWMQRASAIASESPSGPVLLSISEDVLSDTAVEPMDDRPTLRLAAGAPDISAVVEALSKSERPIIIAGSQIQKRGGSDLLAAFAAANGIPVLLGTPFFDRLPLPIDHPNALGPESLPTNRELVEQADCVLAIGTRLLSGHAPHQLTYPGAKFIAHVNEDAADLNPLTNTQWACACDSVDFLKALQREVGIPDTALLQRRNTRLDEQRAKPPFELAPWAEALHDATERGWLVDESISLTLQTIYGGARGKNFGRYTSNSGAALGWGIGAAIGIALATDGPVTCVLGDGTTRFGMNALWTARAYNLPILLVVVNNGGFGSTRAFEQQYVDALKTKFHGEPGFVGSDLTDLGPPVAHLFRGFDIPCVAIKDGPDVRKALVEAWEKLSEGPQAIVVDVGFGSSVT